MTAQVREILNYNDKTYWLSSEPLKPLLNIIGDVDIIGDEEPSSSKVVMASTACWRGYIGTWEIIEDKLYLIELEGYPGNNKRFTMNSLFPNQKKVFAAWFTGEIKIPQGKMLLYEHIDYASIFERDLFLKFNKGMLVGSREVDNTKTFDPKDPYGMKEFNEIMAKDFYDKQNKGKASKP